MWIIWTKNCITNEWRNTVVIPLFKKCDRKDPKNYRGISIVNTWYKMHSKILNIKLQGYSEWLMTETQNWFQEECSCTDPTFCLKFLIKKWKEYNLANHLLFIDYEKSFVSIQRQILFHILKYRNFPGTLLKAIFDTHRKQSINKIYLLTIKTGLN